MKAKETQIVAIIFELRKICESLKDWKKTAVAIGSLGSSSTHPEWIGEKLDSIASVRNHLIEFNRLRETSD